jgi:hypothetical protein
MNINISSKIFKSNTFLEWPINNFYDRYLITPISSIPDKNLFLEYETNKDYLNIVNKNYDFFNSLDKINNLKKEYNPIEMFKLKGNYFNLFFKSEIYSIYHKYLKDELFLILTDKYTDYIGFNLLNIKNFNVLFFSDFKYYKSKNNTEKLLNKYNNQINTVKKNYYNNIFLSILNWPFFNLYFNAYQSLSKNLEVLPIIFDKLNNNGNLILYFRLEFIDIFKNFFKLLSYLFEDFEIISHLENDFFFYLICKKFIKENSKNIKISKKIILTKDYNELYNNPNTYLLHNIKGVSKFKHNFINEIDSLYNFTKIQVDIRKNEFFNNNIFNNNKFEEFAINSYKNYIKNLLIKSKNMKIIITHKYEKLITNYDKFKLNKIFSLTDVYSQKIISLSNMNNNNHFNVNEYNNMTNYYDLQEYQLKNRKYREQENLQLYKNVKSIIEDFARGVSHYINDYYPLEFKVSNAFLKSWEIYSYLPLSFKKNNSNKIISFHFAELPGNFIKSLEYFILNKLPNKSLDWIAESLNPKNPINIKIFGNKIFNDPNFVKKFKNKWIWGPNNNDTGNIMDLNILKYFRKINLQRKPNLLTSDAGLDEEKMDLFTLQKLEFAQAFAVISSSVQGSDVIVKHFMPFMVGKEDTRFSGPYFTSLLFFYRKFFKELYFFKPMTGSPTSSEFYVIGINSKSMNDNEFEFYGQKLNNFSINLYIEDITKIPKLFINQVYTLFDEIIKKINYEAVENFNYLYLFYDEFIAENPNLEKIKNEKYKEWINKYSFDN